MQYRLKYSSSRHIKLAVIQFYHKIDRRRRYLNNVVEMANTYEKSVMLTCAEVALGGVQSSESGSGGHNLVCEAPARAGSPDRDFTN